MTPVREEEIYTEIATMVVPLERSPLAGPEYFADRLVDVRRFQDRVCDLLTEVHRDLASAKIALRGARAVAKVTKDATEAEKAQDRYDSLKGLFEVVALRRSNLRQAGSDIRMLVDTLAELLRIAANVHPTPATLPVTSSSNLSEVVPLRTDADIPQIPEEVLDLEAFFRGDQTEGAPARSGR